MTPVDMNVVHFYKPGEAAGRRKVGRQAVSSSRVSMAREKGNIPPALGLDEEWSGLLLDDDPIEILDITGPLPEEPSNLFQWPAPDFDGIEKDAEDTSNGLNTSRTYGRSGVEEDDYLPTVEELLYGARNAQEWQQTGSSDKHVTGGSEGNLEDAVKNDHNSVASPGSSEGENEEKSAPIGNNRLEDCNTQDAQQKADSSIDVQTYDNLTPDGENKEREAVRPDKSIGTNDDDTNADGFTVLRNKLKPVFTYPSSLEPNDWDNRANSSRKESGSPGDPIVAQDQDIDSSADGASEEQDGNQGSLGTPSTSVAGLETGCSTLNQKNTHDTSNTSSPKRNTLSSTPGKRTCGFKDGNREGLTPDPLTDGDKKNPWHVQKAEADDKKEDGQKHTGDSDKETTPLLGFLKKRGSSAVEGKLTPKRRVKRHRCSPPLPAIPDQNLNIQANTSPPTLEQAREHGDEAQVEEPEWEIKKILAKRETMSGMEYKVRWKSTWIPKGGLGNARKLLRDFEAQRRAQHGHKRGKPARTPLSCCL